MGLLRGMESIGGPFTDQTAWPIIRHQMGVPAMFNEDDVSPLVAHMRLIASDCFDLWAVERLLVGGSNRAKRAGAKGGSDQERR
jgi:hypothetical protein